TTTTQPICVDNGNGTTTCAPMNLMWTTEDSNSSGTWFDAEWWAGSMTLGGFADWRLPTRAELQALYDPTRDEPMECTFGDVHILAPFELTCFYYWTSEIHSPGNAYVVEFTSGGVSWQSQSTGWGIFAMAVRNL
ncbi:DUF1566 domain-containing protein, partial [bacterium]|nr:DUF1566 domain-containing protein [bacterium]